MMHTSCARVAISGLSTNERRALLMDADSCWRSHGVTWGEAVLIYKESDAPTYIQHSSWSLPSHTSNSHINIQLIASTSVFQRTQIQNTPLNQNPPTPFKMRFSTIATTLTTAFAGTVSSTCLTQAPAAIGFPINYDITPSRSDFVTFQIPPNSVGPCSLIATFPADYPITSTGSDLVNVTAIDGPAAGSLVGTLRFRPGTKTFINSFACRDVMTYELAIALGEGEVKFSEIQGAGLFMDVGDCY
ncbi:uncharacterized protein GGS22DRAFT_161119 [Annulohypoxylon maeteangense]|uniref:uncharacterized protein n=1 Tax=Annulohypoxylon maeteangense TaxID=1927788 RepID=UPI00200837D7|nr:uncharacterized protein GGS22DRAFT_161119 [Annulohypoxylon maeteangense]KAI0885516.1 hypothetical protein GGS22DRAFT_161119 [Annulohypoxylon maeteangense]